MLENKVHKIYHTQQIKMRPPQLDYTNNTPITSTLPLYYKNVHEQFKTFQPRIGCHTPQHTIKFFQPVHKSIIMNAPHIISQIQKSRPNSPNQSIIQCSSINTDDLKSEIFRESNITNNKQTSNNSTHDQISMNVSNVKMHDDFIKKQNILLRKQNEILRKQIENLRNQMNVNTIQKNEANRLKNQNQKLIKQKEQLVKTTEKNNKYSKQLQKKNEVFCQENNLYKEIIQKLQKRVEVLLLQNTQLNQSLERNFKKLKEFDLVQNKLERIKSQFSNLEKIVEQDNEEWEMHKQLWVNQKEYYKQIIRKLQFQIKFNS